MTRRAWPYLVAVLATVLAVAGAAVGATGALTGTDRAAVPTEVVRVSAYYPAGPSAEYGSDYGGIGEVDPVRFRVPDGGASYDAVVTVSLQYRAHGGGPFTFGLRVEDAAGKPVGARPQGLRLAPAAPPAGTTLRFLVRGLAPGSVYDAAIGVNSAFQTGGGRSVVTTSKVLVTVDLSPR